MILYFFSIGEKKLRQKKYGRYDLDLPDIQLVIDLKMYNSWHPRNIS